MGAAVPSWINDEAPLVASMWRSLKRLSRRARCSVADLGASRDRGERRRCCGAQSRVQQSYEVTVVLRVSEGGLGARGNGLSRGALRGYLDEVALTSANLQGLMARHPGEFPGVQCGSGASARAVSRAV